MDPHEFTRKQILAVQRTSASRPNPELCWEVQRVARHSPAGKAGLQKGDLILSPTSTTTGPMPRSTEWRAWSDGQELTLTTTGIAPGFTWRPTPEFASKHYDPRSHSTGMLQRLWEAGHWKELERLARLTLAPPTRFWHKLKPPKIDAQNSPAFLYFGCARYEQGHFEEGMAFIGYFAKNYMANYTQDVHASATYYFALEALRQGDLEGARGVVYETCLRHDFDRVKELCAKLEVPVPQRYGRRLNQPWPVGYRLKALEGGLPVTLADTLARLEPHQYLVICLLASYRGNGPYNEFMQTYRDYSRDFAPYIANLHVITSNPERRADRAWWWEQEDLACRDGLAFQILHDPEDTLPEALDIMGSPSIFLVDNAGVIRFEGCFEPCEVWDLVFAKAGMQTEQKF